MTPTYGMMARKAPRYIPSDFLNAALILRMVAEAPPQESAWAMLDITDLGWAATRRYREGAAGPPVSFHGAAQPARIESLTSPEGMLLTPVRQFFRAPLYSPSARCLRKATRLDSSTIRFNEANTTGMEPGELSLLLCELAFAATDHEAMAMRHMALEQFSLHYSTASNSVTTASISPGVVGINCSGRLTDGIAEGAEILRGRGHGGSGLVVYEPLTKGPPACTYSLHPAVQYAGISTGCRIVPGHPHAGQAGAAGIVRVKSRVLDQPLAACSPLSQYTASIMFDPYAAFAVRAVPRLWLKVWRNWDGQGLSVKATHEVCIDMDKSAICLLFHTGA